MIVIFSTSHGDITTDFVLKWIRYKNHNCIRLNGEDIIGEHRTTYNVNNAGIDFNINNIPVDDIKIIWYRRWMTSNILERNDENLDIANNIILNRYYFKEFSLFSDIIHDKLKTKLFNNPQVIPKIRQLELARTCGVSVPNTIISSTKQEILEFYFSCSERIITKSIGNVVTIEENGEFKSSYTSIVSLEDINELPEELDNPILFQEFLEKELELRVFYFCGDFYSMAIFSTLDKRTEVDFRFYPDDRPNRMVPFKLPSFITKRLEVLLEKMNYNNGSIDMILTKDGKYVFLEINSDGQFGMVSTPCNYNLEKKVADKLIQLNQ